MAKGKKFLRFDLMSDRQPDEDLLGLMLGRSGKLRAPAMKFGSTLLLGYNSDLLADRL